MRLCFRLRSEGVVPNSIPGVRLGFGVEFILEIPSPFSGYLQGKCKCGYGEVLIWKLDVN